ncbi:hypothetical protein [Xanthomonas campestris]|uniref:hypothetical protein n=1 Tax=Xanthomonas campestris TaxID=339 RepID=UPI001EDCEBD7|nr:hypothetical protein [Xanthomonas campestris]
MHAASRRRRAGRTARRPALRCRCHSTPRKPYSAQARQALAVPTDQSNNYEGVMSKGMDQKKSQKKEPTKTLKEKRAAKQEKKGK